MLKEIKNLWLLFLPLLISLSFMLRDPPEVRGAVSIEQASENNNNNTFFPIEQSLSRLYVTRNNMLLIDAETEKNLSKMTSHVDLSLDNNVFEKTYPSSQGRKLLKLISCYHGYKKEEQRINELYSALEADQLIDYRNLQKTFFGELAIDLFLDHRTFYKNAEVSGIKLVEPKLSGTLIPNLCFSIQNVE